MSDPARVAAIEEGLASSDPEDVYDASIAIGKQRHRELIARVVPYLTSSIAVGEAPSKNNTRMIDLLNESSVTSLDNSAGKAQHV